MARSTAPKPSETLVEISSDEDEPRLRGPLRGLNPHKDMLPPAATSASIETPQSDASGDKHATRASRNGRSDVSYSMKYHPMDVVTRPNSKAVWERSGSALAGDDDDDDESDPSLPSDTGDSEEEDSASDEEEVRRQRQRFTLTPRTPDPNAVRHSSRPEARKPVLYNLKYHPQDYGITGYQHRAILPSPADDQDEHPRPSQKRKRAESPIEVCSDEDADVDESIPARGPPRKALKSIQNNNQRQKGSKNRKHRAIRPSASPEEDGSRQESPESHGDGHDDLMAIIEDVLEHESVDGGRPVDTLNDIPQWVKDRFAVEHRKSPDATLSRDQAVEMMLGYFQSHLLVPLVIRKPYVAWECGSQRQIESTLDNSSETMPGDSAQETSASTTAGSKPEASPLTLAGSHDAEHASQFEEQMAITEMPPSAWSLGHSPKSDSDLPSTAVPSTQGSAEL